eukprot:gnl/MRDRNA2_/MRDRNA2_124165_c0_seq1.p1 gnl/MRDRNA2_/MRDRNA2_124165_c0~~gnl/MRDRNA2_/MRDRNA2_124165_c0_seq1.p1  ORF type:complete len:487 (+),score=97.24 gnl/MRDRNA2_/MRDRNA2_124165_c0_seq1:85-1461(+)
MAVDKSEVCLIHGALTFREIPLKDVMTPVEDVYMLPASTKLDFETIAQIFRSGFSRIPVYSENVNKPVGLLLTKDLVLVDPNDAVELGAICKIFGRKLAPFHLDQKLGEVFDSFKAKDGASSHMVLAYEVIDPLAHGQEGDPYRRSCGVVTLEDILEEIIQEEIVDETDEYVNVDDHIPVDWAGFDVGRLKLLDPRHYEDDRLSEVEIQAIGVHLQNYVTDVEWPEWENLKILLRNAEVQFKKRTAPTSGYAADEDWLYRAGEPTEKCLFMLKGHCATFAASDSFRAYYGTFTLLGKAVLSNTLREGMFIPDFSACIASGQIRFLVITRTLFESAHALPPNSDPSTKLSDKNPAGGDDSGENIILTKASGLTRSMVANRRQKNKTARQIRGSAHEMALLMRCQSETDSLFEALDGESAHPDADTEIPKEREMIDAQMFIHDEVPQSTQESKDKGVVFL